MPQKGRTSPFLWEIYFGKNDGRGVRLTSLPAVLGKDNLSF